MSKKKFKIEKIVQPIINTEDSPEVKKAKLITCLTEFGATAYVAWDDNTISQIRYDEDKDKLIRVGTELDLELDLSSPCDGTICVTREVDSFQLLGDS